MISDLLFFDRETIRTYKIQEQDVAENSKTMVGQTENINEVTENKNGNVD